MPQLGDFDLRTKPHSSSRASAATRAAEKRRIRAVQSAPLFSPSIRGPAAPRSATRRTLSRGTPIPTSTSGQTETHSTIAPSSSTRNVSRLCCPSKRTFAPSKQADTPSRIRGVGASRAGFTEADLPHAETCAILPRARMPILLDAQQLTASFGARPLFDGVSFTVDEKERIGLIGPNGAGKSTLLRILAEIASADSGTIARRRGLRVALLEQTPRFADGTTVRDAVLEGIGAAQDSPDAHEQERQIFATLALDAAGGGLGPDTPIALLSGGWKKRV